MSEMSTLGSVGASTAAASLACAPTKLGGAKGSPTSRCHWPASSPSWASSTIARKAPTIQSDTMPTRSRRSRAQACDQTLGERGRAWTMGTAGMSMLAAVATGTV